MARRNVSEVWSGDRLWAPVYAYALNRPRLARAGAGLLFHTDFGHLYRAIDRIAEVPAGSSVLDVPCGGGVALRALSTETDVRYVAADIAEDMLLRTAAEAARRGLDQVSTLQADITALPFRDGEFDLTLSFTSLHCLPDPARGRDLGQPLARRRRPGPAAPAPRSAAGGPRRPECHSRAAARLVGEGRVR
jgi:SAM-dependent methyltransferase